MAHLHLNVKGLAVALHKGHEFLWPKCILTSAENCALGKVIRGTRKLFPFSCCESLWGLLPITICRVLEGLVAPHHHL